MPLIYFHFLILLSYNSLTYVSFNRTMQSVLLFIIKYSQFLKKCLLLC